MPADAELLLRYDDDRSDAAFAELVRRHLDGVYSSAQRRVGGDSHLAQDVAQAVFVALARQSRALVSHPFLTAWLYATTRNEAANTVRRERRRKTREAAASAMNEINDSPSAEAAADWSRLSPVLDDAIDQLSETDRAAILLRFIDRRPFAEIGANLHVTEDAARMRVDRALDKLRTLLARRGITSTSAALSLVLANNAVAAAPATVLAKITLASFAAIPAATVTTIGAAATGKTLAGAASLSMKFYLGVTAFMAASFGYFVFAHISTQPVPTPERTEALVEKEPKPTRVWPPEEADARAFLERYPEVKKALIARYHAHFKTRYGHVYRALALNDEEILQLQTLLCEGQYYTSALFPDLKLPVGEGQSKSEATEAIRSLLGPERHLTWNAQKSRGFIARIRVEDLVGALAFTDSALSSYQAGLLLDALTAQRMPQVWDVAIDHAQSFLSAPQLDVLKAIRAGERYGALSAQESQTASEISGEQQATSPPGAALYARLNNSPEMLAAWLDARRVDLLAQYTPFYERLQLTNAQRSAFEQIQNEEIVAHIRRQNDPRLSFEKQRVLLGENGHRQLGEFRKTTPVYPLVTGFASHAALSGLALTRQQCEQLVNTLVSCATHRSNGFVLRETVDWKRVDELAKAILSPDQQMLFHTTEQRGISRFKLQLDNAIHQAIELDSAQGRSGRSLMRKF